MIISLGFLVGNFNLDNYQYLNMSVLLAQGEVGIRIEDKGLG